MTTASRTTTRRAQPARLRAPWTPEENAMLGTMPDQKLARRVDASDVVQDVMLEASQRLDDYIRDPKMPFGLDGTEEGWSMIESELLAMIDQTLADFSTSLPISSLPSSTRTV